MDSKTKKLSTVQVTYLLIFMIKFNLYTIYKRDVKNTYPYANRPIV